MEKIRVAVIGIGNCAKSLVEGVSLYKDDRSEKISGIMLTDIGGYRPGDIEFVAAWDVDVRKVGKPLHQAIKQKPNCAWTIKEDASDVSGNTIVRRSPILDGVAPHMENEEGFLVDHSAEADTLSDVVAELIAKEVDVILNYLPVGSQKATEFFMEAALEAGVAVVNCIPVFIASNAKWEQRFVDAGIPIIGDDMRSELGASIISAVLQELLIIRGHDVHVHYQDNVGGNTDFYNMQDQGRLASKKISKENVIRRQNDLHGVVTGKDTIAAGPAKYFPALGDNKRAHWLIKATGFGGSPVEFTADLSVQDSPNSAGVVIDAIRLLKVAKELGIRGALHGGSAFTQKTPPIDMSPSQAYEECVALAERRLTKYTESQVDWYDAAMI